MAVKVYNKSDIRLQSIGRSNVTQIVSLGRFSLGRLPITNIEDLSVEQISIDKNPNTYGTYIFITKHASYNLLTCHGI